jgi:hypothetical protein
MQASGGIFKDYPELEEVKNGYSTMPEMQTSAPRSSL